MPDTPDEGAIRAALASVTDPSSGRDIVASGYLRGVSVADGSASIVLEVDPARGSALEPLRAAAERAVGALDGIDAASVVLTAHTPAGKARPQSAAPAPPDLRPAKAQPPAGPAPMDGIGRIVAVASGKGGVGKSTVAANLAVALAAEGQRIGLLDADVYGPSQPRMLGVGGRPASPDGHIILPLRNHGVTLMSVGLMVGEDQALAWRGPMLMTALRQMLGQVQWGTLDQLIVDLPPGTGDVQMTLCQTVRVDGALIVSTPQDIALIDARKGVDMFRRMEVPLLGIVENMACFVCTDCGKVHHPFGEGGARAEAGRLDVPFLGEIPLDATVRRAADGGAPIVASRPDSPPAAAFRALARELTGQRA
ncbi:iron-sulfur cluster carrier protein ApbC [Roseovarius spongiae]|uniref:Iron-sulfur cluster carrier protein n=1 Tax=Roseovarius spongiae TaxID=2320272 RepID=A0A3A8ARU5_9RHOB|nr:Mrp/NBP35 family ATP-binding protein [Roseovarius spongiae]RKF12655.1 iron-sulfur cluster carrier protein ApbC [Roseovarius spongiae]